MSKSPPRSIATRSEAEALCDTEHRQLKNGDRPPPAPPVMLPLRSAWAGGRDCRQPWVGAARGDRDQTVGGLRKTWYKGVARVGSAFTQPRRSAATPVGHPGFPSPSLWPTP